MRPRGSRARVEEKLYWRQWERHGVALDARWRVGKRYATREDLSLRADDACQSPTSGQAGHVDLRGLGNSRFTANTN